MTINQSTPNLVSKGKALTQEALKTLVLLTKTSILSQKLIFQSRTHTPK